MVTPGGGGAGFSPSEEQPASVASKRIDAARHSAIAGRLRPIARPLGENEDLGSFISSLNRKARRSVTFILIQSPPDGSRRRVPIPGHTSIPSCAAETEASNAAGGQLSLVGCQDLSGL